jgi:16S rRNA (cytidine1402-2'-O)-methyltransferase
MPGISDPGAVLAREAIAAGVAVFPVPGANAALSALIASGLESERFAFRGFLPAKEGARRSALEQMRAEMIAAGEAATQILYEAPHRIVETLRDVAGVFGEGHRVVLARELTKLHEEFLRGSAGDVLRELELRPSVRGEMVLLLDGVVKAEEQARTLGDEVRALIAGGASEKEALKQVAKARGLGKSEAYREWQRTKTMYEPSARKKP